jgi:hypothetical protein
MSSENQTKNVEIGNTPNENTAAEKPKSEWEQVLETMMRRAYLNGLSTGMKTMCGSILSKMNECQKQRMNPQKQLIELCRWCNHCLAKVSEPPKTEETENKTENQENQEGEKSE